MAGISPQEGAVALAAALFLPLCLLLGRTEQPQPIPPGPELQVVEEQESGYPRSLLPGERIDVNTAPEKDLQRLPGIGQSRAEDIVRYRTLNGPFEQEEDLDRVSGIGAGILEQIGPYITFGAED